MLDAGRVRHVSTMYLALVGVIFRSHMDRKTSVPCNIDEHTMSLCGENGDTYSCTERIV